MKPSSETLELLTVTQQNGFTAHNNRRASLNLTFDKYMSERVTHSASKCIYQWESETVKKDIILEIFGYLKGRNIVSSESEFSEHWLGYSESYMRKLRQMNAEQKEWFNGVHRTANEQLYLILQRCYDLYKAMTADSEVAHKIDQALDHRSPDSILMKGIFRRNAPA